MKSLLYHAQKIDLFGRNYIFEEFDSQRYSTKTGIFFTILIVITCIVIGFLFGQEIYSRDNPTVLNSEEYLDNSRITVKEFPMFFSFVNGPTVNQPTVPLYVDMKITHMIINNDFTPTIKYYDGYKRCNVEEYEEFYQPYIKDIFADLKDKNSMDLYCINQNDLYFQNDYSAKNSSYINVRFLLRTESEGNIDLEARTALLKDLYLVTTVVDSYIDSSNYDNPKNYYVSNKSQKISTDFNQRVFYNIQKISFSTNNGWLLDDEVKEDILSVKSITQDISSSDGNLFWVTLSSPNIRNKIKRSYMKVQDMLAKIGGFFNALYMVILILTKNYVNFSFYNYIYKYFATPRFLNSNKDKKLVLSNTIDKIAFRLAKTNTLRSFLTKEVNNLSVNNSNIQDRMNKSSSIMLNKEYKNDNNERYPNNLNNNIIKENQFDNIQMTVNLVNPVKHDNNDDSVNSINNHYYGNMNNNNNNNINNNIKEAEKLEHIEVNRKKSGKSDRSNILNNNNIDKINEIYENNINNIHNIKNNINNNNNLQNDWILEERKFSNEKKFEVAVYNPKKSNNKNKTVSFHKTIDKCTTKDLINNYINTHHLNNTNNLNNIDAQNTNNQISPNNLDNAFNSKKIINENELHNLKINLQKNELKDKNLFNPYNLSFIDNYVKEFSYCSYFWNDIICCRNKFNFHKKVVAKILSFNKILEINYDCLYLNGN